MKAVSGTQDKAPRFDRIAKPYRWLEYFSFGPLLQRTRTHWLPALADRRQALVLGDGDGRFTAALLAANHQIRVHAVDGSAAMLQLLESRCQSESVRLTTEQADIRNWTPQSQTDAYDLIVTHFFLDCLRQEEAAQLTQRLAPITCRNALWLVSDFAIPSTRYGRWIAAPIIASLYRAFAVLTGLHIRRLPDHAAALQSAGWQLQSVQNRAGGLLFSQIWKRSERS